MDNEFLDALNKLAKEEKQKKKERKVFNVRKEKRLAYYSGWHDGNKPVAEDVKREKQSKLKF